MYQDLNQKREVQDNIKKIKTNTKNDKENKQDIKAKDVFDINNFNSLKVNQYYLELEDFYKNPDDVYNFFNSFSPTIHKWGEKNSLNTIHFLDCRHKIILEEFKEVEKKLYKLLDRDSSKIEGKLLTNFTKFFNIKNQYEENYWWPHTDNNSYNCIIYLNHTPCDGTNLYEKIFDENKETTEHQQPWQSKKNYKLICNIKSKYNKLVVFKSNIYHGLAYNEHKFKNKFRKNQVIFID